MSNSERLKDFYDISHQFLKHGMDLDEQKRFNEAYDYYIEGIKAIDEGLTLKLTTQDWNELNVREIYQKMKKNKEMFGERANELLKMKIQQQNLEKTKKSNTSTQSGGGFFDYLYQSIVGDPNQSSQEIQPQQVYQQQYQPQPQYQPYQQPQFQPQYQQPYQSQSYQTKSSNVIFKPTNETKPFGQYNVVRSQEPQNYYQQEQQYLQQEYQQHPNSFDNSSNVIFKPFTVSSSKKSMLDQEVAQLKQKYSSSFTIPPRNTTTTTMNSTEVKLQNAKKHHQPTLDNSPKQNSFQQKVETESIQPQFVQQKKPKQKLKLNEIPELKNVDSKLLDTILNEIIDSKSNTKWSDIAGLKDAKQAIYETIILPTLKPDFFTGIRAPARGILLFGPPGNGKTLLAKAIANECDATFFNISAASLVSKWHGEGEKLVRALFAAARYLQPSIIFIDEIDSILTSRSSSEHDASRRMKTEFLVQLDGVSNGENEKVVLMGATNVPFELDEAILRRFPKKILIPLPDFEARIFLIKHLLKGQKVKISKSEMDEIGNLTENYSGSDLKSLCTETSMIPIRELGNQILNVTLDQIRPIDFNDFLKSIKTIKPNATKESLNKLYKWNKEFGNF